MRTFPFMTLVAFAMLAMARSATAKGIKMNWEMEGVAREALVFAPSGLGELKVVPVIFCFHGHGGNMNASARSFNFQSLWPEALVVYPQGLLTKTTVDPEGKKPGWQRQPGELDDRDVKFFDAMLATLQQKYPVDNRRIYACGMSNGAMFTYLLWCMRGKTLAAVAPCAGHLWPNTHPATARPALIIQGEKDPLVKYADTLKTIAEVKKLNDCSEEGKEWQFPGTVLYSSAKGDPVVTFIHPGGHIVPTGANELMVKFFQWQHLPE
jgi:polyhydroxybutyrate depolymerase